MVRSGLISTSSKLLCMSSLPELTNDPYIQRHINYFLSLCYTINHTLIGKGEMPYECVASCLLNGASCLLNGASYLLNVGRLVSGRFFFGARCFWGELSVSIIIWGTSVSKAISGSHAARLNIHFIILENSFF